MEQKNKRPEILVVDMDEGYVNALEIKIVQKYIAKADIEFITDRIYLQEYLKKEHEILILVVSESMYSEEMKSLLPVYTFILMDEIGNEKLGEFVYGIFRYSSSQSILNMIENRVPDALFEEKKEVASSIAGQDLLSDLDFKTKVVLVTSASGGVGKTTIALALAFIAEEDKQKIIYFNMDCLSNFDRWIQKTSNEFEKEILEVNKTFSDEMDNEQKLTDLYEIITSNKYDLVIIDGGINILAVQSDVCERADLILQITGKSSSNIYAANKLYRKLNEKWDRKSIYVCGNDIELSCKEHPEFVVQNHISHITDYERMTIDDIRRNADFIQLYQDMRRKLEDL